MNFMIKFLQVIFAFLILTPSILSAEILGKEILKIQKDEEFRSEIDNINKLNRQGIKKKINEIILSAENELNNSLSEKGSLEKQIETLKLIQDSYKNYQEVSEDYKPFYSKEVFLNNDECSISTQSEEFKRSYQKFECDKEYDHAINIWKRTELANKILRVWKDDVRVKDLDSINDSFKRWGNFSANVTSDQFPWETILNGIWAKGTISTPPTYQYRLIHPIAVLLYDNNNERYNKELGLELLGYRSYTKKYKPDWGVSVATILRSETSRNTGYGLTYSTKNFTIGVVWQETFNNDYDKNLIIGYNLASLFANKKNELATKRREFKGKVDSFLQN